MLSNDQPSQTMKRIDLFICHLGNGATCSDKSSEQNGDFNKVAHISTDGLISYYTVLHPDDTNQIEQYAWSTYGEKHRIATFCKTSYPGYNFHPTSKQGSDENIFASLQCTLRDSLYDIILYRHPFSPTYYAKDIFIFVSTKTSITSPSDT